jgi:cytochrome c553
VLLSKTFLAFRRTHVKAAMLALGLPFLVSRTKPPQSASPQPPVRVPSYIAWTEETIDAASTGDAFRGLVIAHRCARYHGQEGFSSDPLVPNLAGMDKLAMWKELNDFRDGKRQSAIMGPLAAELAVKDYSDLAAYYAMLPTYSDPGDLRSFPQPAPASTQAAAAAAARLISGGDGVRGIPPCQACHGPIGHKLGVPSLIAQNADYIRLQLEEFAKGNRSNDINMPMRTIASLLTDDERQSVASYYGSGAASTPVGTFAPRERR